MGCGLYLVLASEMHGTRVTDVVWAVQHGWQGDDRRWRTLDEMFLVLWSLLCMRNIVSDGKWREVGGVYCIILLGKGTLVHSPRWDVGSGATFVVRILLTSWGNERNHQHQHMSHLAWIEPKRLVLKPMILAKIRTDVSGHNGKAQSRLWRMWMCKTVFKTGWNNYEENYSIFIQCSMLSRTIVTRWHCLFNVE